MKTWSLRTFRSPRWRSWQRIAPWIRRPLNIIATGSVVPVQVCCRPGAQLYRQRYLFWRGLSEVLTYFQNTPCAPGLSLTQRVSVVPDLAYSATICVRISSNLSRSTLPVLSPPSSKTGAPIRSRTNSTSCAALQGRGPIRPRRRPPLASSPARQCSAAAPRRPYRSRAPGHRHMHRSQWPTENPPAVRLLRHRWPQA